jgi:hypothetical protein
MQKDFNQSLKTPSETKHEETERILPSSKNICSLRGSIHASQQLSLYHSPFLKSEPTFMIFMIFLSFHRYLPSMLIFDKAITFLLICSQQKGATALQMNIICQPYSMSVLNLLNWHLAFVSLVCLLNSCPNSDGRSWWNR